eukprot:gene8231-9678_t
MYVYGGHLPDSHTFIKDVKSDLHEFNFDRKKWNKKTPKGIALPEKTEHSAVVYKESILNLETFEGTTIQGKGEVPSGRSAHCSVVWEDYIDGPCSRSRLRTVVYGNYLWCLGGWDRSSYYNDLWRFNLETRTWTKINSNFELNGIGQYSLVTHKNQIYIYGGYNPSTSSPQPNLYTYMVGSWNQDDEEVMALEKIYEDDGEDSPSQLINEEMRSPEMGMEASGIADSNPSDNNEKGDKPTVYDVDGQAAGIPSM